MTEEYPRKADLRTEVYQPLPFIAPGTIDPSTMSGEEATKQALAVLAALNAALDTGNADTLAACFFAEQAFWRDMLALTYHLRTFATADVVARAFLETKMLRGLSGAIEIEGAATFVPATPVLVSDTLFF